METFVLQTLLAWPRQPLFNYLADIENNVEWQTQVMGSRWITKTPERSESVFREVWLIGSREVVMRFKESVFWPLARRAFETHSNGIHIDLIFHFVDQGPATLFKMEVRAGGANADREFVEWLRAACEENLQRLKLIVDQDNEQWSGLIAEPKTAETLFH